MMIIRFDDGREILQIFRTKTIVIPHGSTKTIERGRDELSIQKSMNTERGNIRDETTSGAVHGGSNSSEMNEPTTEHVMLWEKDPDTREPDGRDTGEIDNDGVKPNIQRGIHEEIRTGI